jgi:hypothetical protein
MCNIGGSLGRGCGISRRVVDGRLGLGLGRRREPKDKTCQREECPGPGGSIPDHGGSCLSEKAATDKDGAGQPRNVLVTIW